MFLRPTSDKKFHQIYWQTWADLVFVHWSVDPDILASLLPPELEPDLYEGEAYVGLVPFRMTGIRPVFLPALPGLSRTLETNVRTYVKHRNRQGDPAPSVWFFSLEAENTLAVILARLGYGLPYFKASMWLKKSFQENGHMTYAAGSHRHWPKPAPVSSLVQAEFGNEPLEAAKPGSLEHFLVERYALYAKRRGRLLQAFVNHPPYRIAPGRLLACEPWLITAAGLPTPSAHETAIVHRAADVRVRIGRASIVR